MKSHLSYLLLGASIACIALHSLSAADTLNPINPVKSAITTAKTISLEDLKFSEKNSPFGKIEGTNITLNSDLSTKEKFAEFWGLSSESEVCVSSIAWHNVADFQAYTLSGNGVMLRGTFIVSSVVDTSQFTIERGIKFLHTHLLVAGRAKLIFKGEFISSPYLRYQSENYTPFITIVAEASIDLNDAILNPDNSLTIEMLEGRMIRNHHSISKNYRFTFEGNAHFDGNLSIASDAELRVRLDSIFGVSKLQVTGSLNFESNSSIEFIRDIKKKDELMSGMLIASAASITGDLSSVTLRQSLYYYDNYDVAKPEATKRSTILKDMKLISVKNGEHYDLILQRISSEAKK